jgi:hypothetical protein
MIIELTDAGDVRALLAQMSRVRFRPLHDRIAIRLPGVPPAERFERELSLNTSLHDCGCSVGGAFTLFGLLACTVYLWTLHGAPWQAPRGELISSLLIVLGFALIGKLVGLVRARLTLLSDLRALHKQVLPSEHRGQ